MSYLVEVIEMNLFMSSVSTITMPYFLSVLEFERYSFCLELIVWFIEVVCILICVGAITGLAWWTQTYLLCLMTILAQKMHFANLLVMQPIGIIGADHLLMDHHRLMVRIFYSLVFISFRSYNGMVVNGCNVKRLSVFASSIGVWNCLVSTALCCSCMVLLVLESR